MNNPLLLGYAIIIVLLITGCVGTVDYIPDANRFSMEEARAIVNSKIDRLYCASNGHYVSIEGQIEQAVLVLIWPRFLVTDCGKIGFRSSSGSHSFTVPLKSIRLSSIYQEMGTYKVYFHAKSGLHDRAFMIWVKGPFIFPYVRQQNAFIMADALTTLRGKRDDEISRILDER